MILTFGSINADIVVPVPKLPQPGETVLGGSYEILPGGKGANQALAAGPSGADVMLAGRRWPRRLFRNRPRFAPRRGCRYAFGARPRTPDRLRLNHGVCRGREHYRRVSRRQYGRAARLGI